MSINIELNYLNDQGEYEILYPIVSFSNMTGSLTSDQIPDLNMSKITAGNLSASRISGTVSSATSATSASKLSTARTIQTDLAKTTAVNFDGQNNIEPGVKGILGVENGGTGYASLASLKTALGINDSNAIFGSYTPTGNKTQTINFINNTKNYILFCSSGKQKNSNYHNFIIGVGNRSVNTLVSCAFYGGGANQVITPQYYSDSTWTNTSLIFTWNFTGDSQGTLINFYDTSIGYILF